MAEGLVIALSSSSASARMKGLCVSWSVSSLNSDKLLNSATLSSSSFEYERCLNPGSGVSQPDASPASGMLKTFISLSDSTPQSDLLC